MRRWKFPVLLLIPLGTMCWPPSSGQVVVPERILILAPSRVPVVEQVVAEIERRNERLAGSEPAIRVDFRSVSSRAEAVTAIESLLPIIGHYRAIFTPSQTLARAAQTLVSDRPIVFDGVDDPVSNCLVDSLRRPGRNATGYMHLLPDTELKMLEVLHESFPEVKKVVVLASGHNVSPRSCDLSDPVWRGERPACEPGIHRADSAVARLVEGARLEGFGRELGVEVRFLVLCEAADFDLVSVAASEEEAAGFVVPWHTLFDDHRANLVSALARAKRPTIYASEAFTKIGGLLSLEPILDRGKDRASVISLMQVLDGRLPATLPVQRPRGFEIVFNAGATAKLGLQPSAWLLRRADRTLR
jgi:putative tryptophan/tyrosine transport system substrate-binding protein